MGKAPQRALAPLGQIGKEAPAYSECLGQKSHTTEYACDRHEDAYYAQLGSLGNKYVWLKFNGMPISDVQDLPRGRMQSIFEQEVD